MGKSSAKWTVNAKCMRYGKSFVARMEVYQTKRKKWECSFKFLRHGKPDIHIFRDGFITMEAAITWAELQYAKAWNRPSLYGAPISRNFSDKGLAS